MSIRTHRYAALRRIALVGAGAAAMAAQAAPADSAPPSAPTSASTPGVMSFPNVRVEVQTPQPGAKSGAATPAAQGQAGMRGFIDPATGQLVQPTAEQAAELESATPPKRGSALRTQPSAKFYPAIGGTGLALDDSTSSYSIARKAADGSIETDCLPKEAALKALKSSDKQRARKTASAVKGDVK